MESTQPSAGKFQNKRRTPFTMLANAMLRNPDLSLKAKGLLGIMLSFPDNWQYHMSHIETLSTDGRDAHRNALQELERAGYIQRQQTRNSGGRLSESVYRVSDEVCTVDGFSGNGLSGDGKPDTSNTDLRKTDLKKLKDGAASRTGQDHAPSQDQRSTPQASQRKDATSLETVPPAAVSIPASLLARVGFEEAWGDWLAYRRKRRLSCLPVTLQKQLLRLAAESDPIDVISYTIEQGYQGLVAPKYTAPRRPQTQAEANDKFRQGVEEKRSAIQGVFDD